jgi:hypothetical protein
MVILFLHCKHVPSMIIKLPSLFSLSVIEQKVITKKSNEINKQLCASYNKLFNPFGYCKFFNRTQVS